MVRVLSMMALAAVAVVAAVAPAAAMPTIAARPAEAPSASASPTFPFAAALNGAVSVRKTVDEVFEPVGMILRALRPAWKAYKSGQLDAGIADFQAGKWDPYLPTQADVLHELDMVFHEIKMVVPKVAKLLAEIKAGKYDAQLAAAKKGNLRSFLGMVAHWLYPYPM